MATVKMRTAFAPVAAAIVLYTGLTLAGAAVAPQSDLNEVLVQAQRVQLREMRKELVQLEDRIFARYDELNTKDEFDIHCFKEARTGTRFVKRTCRAQYEEDAVEDEGRQGTEVRQVFENRLRAGYPQPPVPPAPPMMAILARLDEFRANMKNVVSSDPQLLSLLRDRAELAKRYEATRRRIFKRHPTASDVAADDADSP